MTITFAQLVVWIVVGAAAGSLAGSLVTGKWEGLGRWTSLGIGLVGASIGGAIFRLFGIWPALDAFAISLRDVVAALAVSWRCFGSAGGSEVPVRRDARGGMSAYGS